MASIEYEPARLVGPLRIGPVQNDWGDRKIELAVHADSPDVVSTPGWVPGFQGVYPFLVLGLAHDVDQFRQLDEH
eukprot:14565982-Heterocapsa_arctica.AAC.1